MNILLTIAGAYLCLGILYVLIGAIFDRRYENDVLGISPLFAGMDCIFWPISLYFDIINRMDK